MILENIARNLLAGLLASLLGVAPAALADDIAAGKAKAQLCVACHGVDGISRLPDGPHIAGQSAIYLTAQLRAYRSGERSHPQMSIVAGGLSDEDIANLAAWYSAIKVSVELPE